MYLYDNLIILIPILFDIGKCYILMYYDELLWFTN